MKGPKHSRAHALRVGLASALVVAGASGCPKEPEIVDLGKLRLALWQPEALASGDGDLLDDAARVDVTLVVDGQERDVSLDGLSADALEAAADGAEVRAIVRTTGNTLPDALARSPKARLEPEGGDLTFTAILAPPGVSHALSVALPPARTAMAVCSSTSGRTWAISGLRAGTNVQGGSFVIDLEGREVREGPEVPSPRAFAACAADEEGGVYLAGGCDANGTEESTLVHSATGELGSPFGSAHTLPGAGCDTRLVRTSAGTLVAVTSTHIHYLREGDAGFTSKPLPMARYAPVVIALPGERERVLIGAGYADSTKNQALASSLLYDLETGPVQISAAPLAATREGDDVILVDRTRIARLLDDGALEVIYNLSLPSNFVPRQIAPLHDGRYALLDPERDTLRIAGQGPMQTVALPGMREHLISDAGGALYLLGGDTPGVTVIVVE